MLGLSMGLAAWGLVTGMTMGKSGLGVPLSVAMSLLVFAGSSQLAALPLIVHGAPIWVVWATAACVNLRFVIFSAQWRPYFSGLSRPRRLTMLYFMADLNYVMFMHRFPEPKPAPEQVPYLWGGVAVNWTAWQVPSLLGILLADSIPERWGIGFAGTLALIGLTCSLLVDRATIVAAAVAGCAAVAAYALPLKLNILVAIASAVAVGILIDRTTARPVKPAPEST
jgi:predicted branched-subunit amino acid permease